jgi:hypothetical protein
MTLIFNHFYSQIIVRILLQQSVPTSVSVTFSHICFLLKKAMNIYPAFLSGDPKNIIWDARAAAYIGT